MNEKFIDIEKVKEMFCNRDYIYFLTIKPPPNELIHIRSNDIHEYLNRKNLTNWIVKCKSPKGYVHFHGLINFMEHQEIRKGNCAALKRKVQRDMGFVQCDPLFTSVVTAYDYIRSPNNDNISEHYTKRVSYTMC